MSGTKFGAIMVYFSLLYIVWNNSRNDAIPHPNHTYKQCGKYVVHDTLTVIVSR